MPFQYTSLKDLAVELNLSSNFMVSALWGGVMCLYLKPVFSIEIPTLRGFWQDWEVITLETAINQKFPPR